MGESWNQLASIVNDQAKTLLQNLATANPNSTAFQQDPVIVGSKLREHLARTTAAAQEVAASIRDSDQLTEDQKNAHAARLRQKAFAQPPVARPTAMSEGGDAEKDMEIAMYMALVMSTDHLVTTRRVPTADLVGGRSIIRTERSRQAIQTADGRPTRPLAGNQSIEYDRIGGTVERKIDTLYRQRRYGQAFFYGGSTVSSGLGRDEIERAGNTLNTISERYSLTRVGPNH